MKIKQFKQIALFAILSIYVCFSCNNLDNHNTDSHDHSLHQHNEENTHEDCNKKHASHSHIHSSDVESHKGHNHNKKVDEHNHTDEIELSDHKAKHFGVKTEKVKKQTFNDIIKVSGEILPAQGELSVITAKSSGILRLNSNAIVGKQLNQGSVIGVISSQNIMGGDANETAYINYEAAKRELERITPLYKDKIITEKEYNQAKQIYEQAKAALVNKSGAGSSATSNISGTLTEIWKKDGEFVEVGTPIAVVSKNSKLVLRADLPNRYSSLVSSITTAHFRPAYSEITYDLAKLSGIIVSNKNLSVVTPGYIPISFEFNNTESIVPGSYAEIYLVGASKANCIVLPIDAITEEQGYYFVYKKVHPEKYSKKEVKIGVNNGEFVEILSGIHEGEEIVMSGAIIVKLASQTNAVPGHNHEH